MTMTTNSTNRRSTMFKLNPLVYLALAGATLVGCAEGAVTPTEPNKVAELDLGNGVQMEIVALDDGSFLTTQTGRFGSNPVEMNEILRSTDDPVTLFKRLAPDQPVPAKLIAANERSVRMAKDQDQAIEPKAPTPGTLEPVRSPPIGEVNYAVSSTQSNWTGYPGCPPAYFSTRFCPGNTNNSACMYNVTWASFEHDNAKGGTGAVCADQGQITFRITRAGVTEFTVDQGSWRTAVLLSKRTCGWFSCSDVRNYTRFEIVNRPDQTVGHFGATIDY
jgi:hypothetical protein